jgi:hypothetical protein
MPGLIVFLMGAVLALGVWVDILRRKLAMARRELDVAKRGQLDLVAENLEQASTLDRLAAIEQEFYALRRDNGRANTTIARLTRMQAGVSAMCEKLEQEVLHLASADSQGGLQSQVEALRQQVASLLDWSRRLHKGEAAVEAALRQPVAQSPAIDSRLRAAG